MTLLHKFWGNVCGSVLCLNLLQSFIWLAESEHVNWEAGGDPVALILIGIVLSSGGLLATLGVAKYTCHEACYDDILRQHKITNWVACHIFRAHCFETVKEIYDGHGSTYKDKICIHCGNVRMAATRFERHKKFYDSFYKPINRSECLAKVKKHYHKKLTKDELTDLFVEQI